MRGGSVLLVSYTQFKHTVLNKGVRLCWRRGILCDKSTSVAEDSGRGANPVPGCQDP